MTKNELAEDIYFVLVPFVSKRRRLFIFLGKKKTTHFVSLKLCGLLVFFSFLDFLFVFLLV